MKENRFCLYFHINPITIEIFYVGIGNSKRPFNFDHRSKFWKNYVNKYGEPIVEVVETEMSWEWAQLRERYWIRKIGRRKETYNGQPIPTRRIEGPLVNFTDGGEGGYGCKWNVGRKHTEKATENIRKGGFSNKKHTEETKNKMSESHKNNDFEGHWKGKSHSEESNKKRSETMKKRRAESDWSTKKKEIIT